MDHSSNTHFSSLAPAANIAPPVASSTAANAPAANITPPVASSTAANDTDIYDDPGSLDLDAISTEELEALIQEAVNRSNASSSTSTATPKSLTISQPSQSEASLPTASAPKPLPEPNPLQSNTSSSTSTSTPKSLTITKPSSQSEASLPTASQSEASLPTTSAAKPLPEPNPLRSPSRSPRNLRLQNEIILARNVQRNSSTSVSSNTNTSRSSSAPQVFAVAVRTYSGSSPVASIFQLETFSDSQAAVRCWEAQTRAGKNPSFIAAKNHDEIIRWVREQGM